ncbi:protein tyrosine phosphatase type IVA [Entomortierella parvispora]|uniref:protein-tyrosine-phosphatase n=1 Tax=Entomortierella parvispora TaxID=205924 RepID=A0A9P3LU52_9FUNG|nr:protein tyrosine phosphatase type IVA [Entomortierella parvispora]
MTLTMHTVAPVTVASPSARSSSPSMVRTVSSDDSSTSSNTTVVNPPTAVARLLRLPTPPRSPGLAPLGKQLTLIEPPMTKSVRFLILDCPTDSTLPFYLAELKRHNVTDVVRCCEPTYRAETLQAERIEVHDWPFRDGAVPPTPIIKNWLQLVDSRITRRRTSNASSGTRNSRANSPASASDDEDSPSFVPPTIAVHCVAGLGRAPILVALAMIELGMANLDTVEFIRRRRRGCFNNNQIQYIDGYKRGKALKHPLGHASGSSGSDGVSTVKNGFSKMFRLTKA